MFTEMFLLIFLHKFTCCNHDKPFLNCIIHKLNTNLTDAAQLWPPYRQHITMALHTRIAHTLDFSENHSDRTRGEVLVIIWRRQ